MRKKFAATADWCGRTSRGAGADESVIAELAELNKAYKDRFGYIFIVCASSLTAAEMLEVRVRLPHVAENEIRIAAGEQAKITAYDWIN